MKTKAQLESRKRNFAIFRVRGAISLFTYLMGQFDFPECAQCVELCSTIIGKIKGRR